MKWLNAFSACLKQVASVILADVEPWLPARRNGVATGQTTVASERFALRAVFPDGKMPPSTAGKDACRHLFRPALMMLAAIGCPRSMAYGQLTLATNIQPQQIFFGQAKSIPVVIHNHGDQIWAGEIRARLLQTSSATVIRLGESPGKEFQALPGQTVVESAQLDFPAVKAE